MLSTSWVRTYGCAGAAKRLPIALQQRVIGATFHSRTHEHEGISEPAVLKQIEVKLAELGKDQ